MRNIFQRENSKSIMTWSSLFLSVMSISLVDINAQAVNNPAYLWPNATVPFEISLQYSVNDAALIVSGLAEITKYTCIQFVPRTNEADYVTFMEHKALSQSKRSCWGGKWGSIKVGNQRGQHIISLYRDLGCLKKFIIIHEMLHILGFFHEQTRGDRDNYIYINRNNIDPYFGWNIYYNLNENSGPDQQITYLETNYDTDSIMQYHPFSFALDPRRPVMSPKDPCNPLRNVVQLSPINVARINKLYKCPGDKPVPPEVKRVPVDYLSLNPKCSADAKAGRCESEPMYMNSVCGKSCCARRNSCVDSDLVNCLIWASNGECVENSAYMLTYCRRSCKQCSSTCEDSNRNCAIWAAIGECIENPGYMLNDCAKSCKQC